MAKFHRDADDDRRRLTFEHENRFLSLSFSVLFARCFVVCCAGFRYVCGTLNALNCKQNSQISFEQ